MTGALAAIIGGGVSEVLDTTVHAASLGGNINGYMDGFGGSMDDYTFVDRSGATRTIAAVYGDGGFDTVAFFALNEAGVPNTPMTFAWIESGGVKFFRNDATYNGADPLGSSWTWGNGIFAGGAGDHNLLVFA